MLKISNPRDVCTALLSFRGPEELARALLLVRALVVHPPIAHPPFRFRGYPTRVALRVHLLIPLSPDHKPCNLPRPGKVGARR